MPLGSSSDAPVMRPGPSSRTIRGFFGSDAGAGGARLVVIDMECFYRSTSSDALSASFGSEFRMRFPASRYLDDFQRDKAPIHECEASKGAGFQTVEACFI
jgi:hypothetical protein